MKRITFVLASLLMLLGLKATAQNERVLLFECFTNTSCGPCASQNPALDALISNNGERIAAIKYHMNWPGANDPMYLHNTVDNNARKSVYNVSSVPHTVVDGIRFANVPGSLNQNMVNNWLNISSPLEMRLSYELDENANVITVHVMGRATSPIAGSCKLYIGVIEKEIHYTSAPGTNGERDFYSVMKKLLPSATGTYIGEMAEGDYFAYTFTWEWANVYNVDQLDAIAWVQNPNSKEVYQACRSSQTIEPFYTNDAGVSNLTNMKSVSCSGYAQPEVTISNFGSNPLTSAELEIVFNGEVINTVEWNGNLPIFGADRFELGEFNFPVEEENTLEVRIAKINGGNDEAPSNNVASYQFSGAPLTIAKVLKLTIHTDNNPQETTWQVKNMATGEIVQQGGPYDQANHNFTETLEITGDGCYDFTIFDAGGDGLNDGNGFYGLRAGNSTLFSGGDFADFESNELSFEVTADVEESLGLTTTVYPNPTTGLLNIVCEGKQNVTLYNMSGQRVFEGVADGWLKIDTKPFGAGVYAVTVGDKTMRIVVK